MSAAIKVDTPNMDRVLDAWRPAQPPEWIAALAKACDGASQGKVAARLGISPAVVNQLLGNSYKGRTDRMETRIRGELMRETVVCPVLGDISRRDCLDHQRRKFSPTNLTRVRLFQTCPTCPHREDA